MNLVLLPFTVARRTRDRASRVTLTDAQCSCHCLCLLVVMKPRSSPVGSSRGRARAERCVVPGVPTRLLHCPSQPQQAGDLDLGQVWQSEQHESEQRERHAGVRHRNWFAPGDGRGAGELLMKT